MEHAYLDLDGRSYGMRPEILVRYVQKQGSKGRLFSATLGVCVPIASDSRLRPSRSSRSLSELQESRGSHAFHIPSRALIAPRTCGVASKHPDRLPRPLFSNAGSNQVYTCRVVCVCRYIFVYACIHSHMYLNIHMYIYICIYTYIYTYVYMHTHIYIYICMYVCIHVHMYIHIVSVMIRQGGFCKNACSSVSHLCPQTTLVPCFLSQVCVAGALKPSAHRDIANPPNLKNPR